ncbi:MAG: YdcF family protein [Bryobacteraceae bacterium]
MFVSVLSKCLPILLMPLGASVILLLFGLRWRRRLLTLLSLLILYVFGTPVTADLVMRSLEDRYPRRDPAQCPQSDAIFVFGGMLSLRGDGTAGPDWNEAEDRFDKALSLYVAGKAPLLVFSGGPERFEGGPDEGDMLRNEALRRGVPDTAIGVTRRTWNTESEAGILCSLARERKWKRVLVVTSAYHMPRAMLLSGKCEAERVPVPVAYQTPAPHTTWAFRRPEYYFPQGRALAMSETALHEYWGMLFHASLHLR